MMLIAISIYSYVYDIRFHVSELSNGRMAQLKKEGVCVSNRPNL